MKKIAILMMVLMASLTTATFAQNERGARKTAEQRADMATKRLTEKLGLTTEQATNIHEVILKREKLRDAGKLTREDRQKIVGDINKYLSKEQQDKWEAMRKEAREHKGHHGHGKGTGEGKGGGTDDTGDDVY